MISFCLRRAQTSQSPIVIDFQQLLSPGCVGMTGKERRISSCVLSRGSKCSFLPPGNTQAADRKRQESLSAFHTIAVHIKMRLSRRRESISREGVKFQLKAGGWEVVTNEDSNLEGASLLDGNKQRLSPILVFNFPVHKGRPVRQV